MASEFNNVGGKITSIYTRKFINILYIKRCSYINDDKKKKKKKKTEIKCFY